MGKIRAFSEIIPIALLFALMIFPIVFANATSEVPQVAWEKTYGTGNRDAASSVIQTSDGGYAVVGSYEFGYDPSHCCLLRLTRWETFNGIKPTIT